MNKLVFEVYTCAYRLIWWTSSFIFSSFSHLILRIRNFISVVILHLFPSVTSYKLNKPHTIRYFLLIQLSLLTTLPELDQVLRHSFLGFFLVQLMLAGEIFRRHWTIWPQPIYFTPLDSSKSSMRDSCGNCARLRYCFGGRKNSGEDEDGGKWKKSAEKKHASRGWATFSHFPPSI